jgi:hypothetical protein
VVSIDKTSVDALEKMDWRPFSSMGQAIFSLLGVKPEGKKWTKKQRHRWWRKRRRRQT